MLNKRIVLTWFERAAESMAANKDELGILDAAIGDADHGINMDRGFNKLRSELPKMEDLSLGEMLKRAGMVLLSSIGGASGPLYGALFLKGAITVGDANELDAAAFMTFLATGVAGLVERGRTEENEKTMYDVWAPVLREYKKNLDAGMGLEEILKACVDAAETGMKATIPMLALKGRASYLGERSIGHQDPGATSSYYLITALYESVRG
ncbi:dihydroxyacetone kinase subunit DhaL [Halodesulfovibrio marinisediminis]|uniref:Dihydroxyacetone kinase DhaL subunit n=1 Tax=Halodesulfovibrio marinisediminis DSM 17456 TaxID=1121457 RepID=A0A1N6FV56_9BACT|nr:dihydroxyacetone kinase subunit DhaL [Halodesulfovibrio marinisediminis]SIN99199.1 dihydroxyacetone kinase DhaL subunit [Halodesulfovibrio marinisediminis DSM 17456]